jgi:eukaryotic-like serine/threonine-protein kinase
VSASRTTSGSTVHVDDVIADRYELEELVGSGGMSSVFRARDRLLDRHVALKVLHEHYAVDDEYVERFRREARSVAQLSHPNIVTVIDRGEDAGRQYIVFEYVAGENLKQLVGRTGALPVRRALELAAACADALAFAHANGLVHRDVKPQNVLIDAEGAVKVTDFGIARSLEVDVGVTQTGTVMGTSNYLSPEQARGRTVTPASDVYSLAIVLWELLAGEVPFEGENFVAVALLHINERPPNLRDVRPDVSPRLASLLEWALAKEPEQRIASMAAFAHELRACLAELDGGGPADTLVGLRAVQPPPQARPARVRRSTGKPTRAMLVVLGALAAAAVVLAVVLGLHRPGSAPVASGPSGGSSAPASGSVSLSGVGDYGPGAKDTHADTASAATDGDPSTFWYTQIYKTRLFGGLKSGIGLVVDAGDSVALSQLTVKTPTPGFTAQIRAGDSPTGPFAADSDTETASGTTTFDLQGTKARYYVVWISRLPKGGKAEISELTATGG